MLTRKFPLLLLLLAAITGYSQKKFSFTPEHPKPGDVIKITYEPAGDIANTILPVDAVVYQYNETGNYKADDIALERNGNQFTGTVQTDPSRSFVSLSFASDKKFDNNFNDGYYILLYDNDKPVKHAYGDLALFYQFYAPQSGVDRSNDKALASMEKEYSMYPDSKKTSLVSYARIKAAVQKDQAQSAIEKDIEAILKDGLKDETDYSNLQALYTLAKLPQQAKFVSNMMKDRFPNGKWTVNETLQKFFAEQDPEKKKEMLASILQKIESGDENWKSMKTAIPTYKLEIAYAYADKKNWEQFKAAVNESGAEKAAIASLYNNTAWEMQKGSDHLDLAEEFSSYATTQAKTEWKNPTTTRPDYATAKQWDKNREATYAMYADTYGMVMYRTGNYKKGLPYSKDAAIIIGKGQTADENNTYALLAEKVLPSKQYKKEIEQFVKDGKSTSEMNEILKRVYVKEHKSEDGFNDYIAALQKENYLKMVADLRKSMLNETAPSFALLDLDGKKVDIADLKGKVVVVDFWATWCGPCKASFPGMQKMVNKYKENPDVKFVFVDTWERVDQKEKNASGFIADNKYSFHVLLDNDSKVVEQFKVDGIPTKFVIDKNGNIRFKAVGFDGSDDKLVSELTAMIDIAANSSSKAF
jgi:thiol-disulfide isomerase/thioredoxin